jgi:hypothetical protein
LVTVLGVRPVADCTGITNSTGIVCILETTHGDAEVELAGGVELDGELLYSHPCPNVCPDVTEGQCYIPLQNNPNNEVAAVVTQVTPSSSAQYVCIINLSDGTAINIERYGSTPGFSEAEFKECPYQCLSTGDGGWHYPALTPCSGSGYGLTDPGIANPYPSGYLSRDFLADSGIAGTVRINGGCFTLGAPSEVDECTYSGLLDEGAVEAGAGSFHNFVGDCECCITEIDPQSIECGNFYDDLCNPIAFMETWDGDTTYGVGDIVWAFIPASVGGSYSKFECQVQGAKNIHPKDGVMIDDKLVWKLLGTCSCDNTCGPKTTKFNI